MENSKLFDLIDVAYNEDLSNQPQKYKEGLLKSANNLLNGSSELSICVDIYRLYHNNYMVPMSFPKGSRLLYLYIQEKLKKLDQKQLRDMNIGYGLIATHFTFGPFN